MTDIEKTLAERDTRIPRHITWPAAAVASLGLWGLMGWLGYLLVA